MFGCFLTFFNFCYSIVDYTSKDEVTEGVHLKNNEYYVAVGSERFKDMEYGIQPAILSPKQQQKR